MIRREQRGPQYGLALHALTCGQCKPKATRVLETSNHIERWELLAQIELHELRLSGKRLHG
jgi:hypothetical protein